MSTDESSASEPIDGSYNDAVSTKMARIWAEMWVEMVRTGIPPKTATKMMKVYLRETLAAIGRS